MSCIICDCWPPLKPQVIGIDLLRFLAVCHKLLNQAVSVLSLSLVYSEYDCCAVN